MKNTTTFACFILLIFALAACKEKYVEIPPDVSKPDRSDTIRIPIPSDTSKPLPAMDKRVFIRVMIKVGEVLYDSIPAQLIVKSWDAKQEMDYKIHYLAAGTQQIYLSAKAVRFELSVSKWGMNAHRTLSQAKVQENALYDLGGELPAKRIRSVTQARIKDGVSKPYTKTDYEYHANGTVKQRLLWGKRADMSTYLMEKDIFGYTDGYITSILTYDESNALLKKQAVRYDAEGRVVSLEETRGTATITTNASYFLLETRSGVTQDYRIDAQYQFENGKYTDYYSKTMHGGIALLDVYSGHTGSREEGTYNYDSCINPYVHLKIPEAHFNQYVKHNMVIQRKIRSGARPQHEPYDFKYTYDADGYPKELMTKYRSVETRADTYMMRTVFTY
ncbi:hypothetical protein SAMN04487996_12527 [Dyadobacter soli]|uniref:YD repeat-containing protein n=1 Tax=Dyadobacter soli TaxID=659014 RepID=A0A1G7Y1T2_9BACT|nr:hypothetical protein [Dyadobacter soli]SDG90323.1 hypothetical protein SAMN04487996_12527 [Dyadobacter soli]